MGPRILFQLSSILFFLYIHQQVERECGVGCGEIIVPGLLFADDTALLADRESADDMRKSLH